MAHEIGHTLGLKHEQARPDRDTYIRYIKKNVYGGRRNFLKLKEKDTETFALPYDYNSAMHYSATVSSLKAACYL